MKTVTSPAPLSRLIIEARRTLKKTKDVPSNREIAQHILDGIDEHDYKYYLFELIQSRVQTSRGSIRNSPVNKIRHLKGAPDRYETEPSVFVEIDAAPAPNRSAKLDMYRRYYQELMDTDLRVATGNKLFSELSVADLRWAANERQTMGEAIIAKGMELNALADLLEEKKLSKVSELAEKDVISIITELV